MKKLPEYTSDDNMFFYMNALVDLVNSQQEAIEKLKEDIRPYTEEELSKMSFWPNREKGEIAMGEKISEPADDKATITTVGTVEDGKAIGWGFDCRDEIPGMTFNADCTQLIAGYTIEELKKIADATHRTVTLRIPKGMTIGDIMWRAFTADSTTPYAFGEWLALLSDTDLQKALDEVEHE